MPWLSTVIDLSIAIAVDGWQSVATTALAVVFVAAAFVGAVAAP